MKKIRYLIFSFIIFLTVTANVCASSITLKSSSNSVTKGSTVTITATISSNGEIYSTEGSVVCSGAGIGNKSLALNFEDNDASSKSKTFPSLSVKPTEKGTITCSTSNVVIYEMSSSSSYSLDNKTITINVTEPQVIKTPTKEYSSNNNLKNLAVDGFDLSPSFKNDVLEYSVEVPNETTKVKISASVEDSNASVVGVGEKDVTEGVNKFEIVVTAENGNEKKYIVIVNVKELNPITVKVGKKEYTVVRKKSDLPEMEYFEESKVKIGEEEVISYYNEKLKIYLIGLKDSEGKTNLYIYDEKNNKYTIYNQITIGGTTIYLKKGKLPNNNYKEYIETINDIDVTIYKLKKNSKIGLIYGVNIITGNEGYYVYDKEEASLQRYYNDEIDMYKEKTNNYFIYLMISIGIIVLILISILIKLIMKKNKKRKRHKLNK